MQQKNTTNS